MLTTGIRLLFIGLFYNDPLGLCYTASMNKNIRIKKQGSGLLIGYAIQFIAGMTLNLFVTISKPHPGYKASNYFVGIFHALIWSLDGNGGLALAIHAYLAIILVLGSLSLLATSIKFGLPKWIWLSVIAAVFTIGALFNGLSYVNYGHNISSMIMACCWLVAVSAIVFGLFAPTRSYSKS